MRSESVCITSEMVEAAEPHIEITPAMIEAALDYVFDTYGDWPLGLTTAREMVAGMFRVMVEAARRDRCSREGG
jgi:hypothetical protein